MSIVDYSIADTNPLDSLLRGSYKAGEFSLGGKTLSFDKSLKSNEADSFMRDSNAGRNSLSGMDLKETLIKDYKMSVGGGGAP